MKKEQIDRITQRLQNSGYGWISKEECRKLILLIESELVRDTVPVPAIETLSERPAKPVLATCNAK